MCLLINIMGYLLHVKRSTLLGTESLPLVEAVVYNSLH